MSEKRETLSIVIPAYNEGGNVNTAAEAIFAVTDREGIDAAIYFVDDGSKDDSWPYSPGWRRRRATAAP